MNDTHTFAASLHQAARPGTSVARRLATLRSIIATRRERARFRWELKQMSKANPHLIDDIGLTGGQVEAEIAKLPFWQR